jgi:hypothetical protein
VTGAVLFRGVTRKAHGPEKVAVPAVTFEAIRVEWWITLAGVPQPVAVRTEWYSQGVGLIKRRDHLTAEEDFVLKSFPLGKD